MKRYRVCQIGCSPARGGVHVQGFLAHPDRFEIVGVCDRLPERLNELGDKFGIAARYDDAEKMLAEQKPEVLCFVTLPEIRLALIELGIRHGVKAIAYEKPMAPNWPEACAIHRAVTAAGVKTIQSHQHKYVRSWQRARELVANGEIGEVQEVRASSKGWMLQYASHLMDYSMFLTGRDRVQWVAGHAHGRGQLFDTHPSPDYLLARYAFADGLPGLLECGTLAPTLPPGTNGFWMDAGVTVRGSDGFVQVVSGSGLWARTKSSTETLRLEATVSAWQAEPPYFRELADWLDDDAKVHPCNGERAFHGYEVFMGACLSALDRRCVQLPLPPDVDILGRLRAELPESL